MRNVALVVEDEKVVRTFVSHVLSILNFDVLEAKTEEEGWDTFNSRHNEINYVFSDIQLEKGNGVSLYHKIRSISDSVMVVLASGYSDYDVSEILLDPNGTFLPKPFNVDLLIETAECATVANSYLDNYKVCI